MSDCTPLQTCDFDPFIYQATPIPDNDEGASSNQVNEQSLEDWTAALLTAICADLTCINTRITDLEARVTALETPP